MLKDKALLCSAALLCAFPTMAHAQDAGTQEQVGANAEPARAAEAAVETTGPVFGGEIGFVTDYRWRGASLSDEDAAVQGGFSGSYKGFYAGIWGSNIGFLNNSEIEIDYYAGYGIPLNDTGKLDLQVKYVTFPGQRDASFLRVSANLTGKIGPVGLGLHADYEPEQEDTLLGGEDNRYLYATAGVDLGSGFSLNGKVGNEDGAFADDKWDWLIGVSTRFQGFQLSAQYIGTNKSGRGVDDTVVFGIKRSF